MGLTKEIKSRDYLALFTITLANQAIGFLVQMVIAHRYGASASLDGYLAGLAIPQYVVLIINTGLSTSLLPAYYNAPVEQRNAFLASVFKSLTLLTLAIAVMGALASRWIFPAIYSDLSPSALAIGTNICAYSFLMVISGVLINFFSSYYYIQKRFTFQASIPVIGQAINALLVVAFPVFGIYTLLWSFLVSQLFQTVTLAARCPVMQELGGPVGLMGPRLKALAWAALPMVGSTIFIKSTGIVERYLGTVAADGASGVVSHVDYAVKITSAIAGLTTNVLPILVFPAIAAAAAEKEYEHFNRTVNEAMTLAAAISVPLIAILFFVATDIVVLLFQRGHFSASDSVAVAMVFRIYLFSLLARSMGGVISNALYALKAVKWVAIGGSVEALLYVAYSYALVRKIGVIGIPVGFLIYFTLSCSWEIALAHRRTHDARVKLMGNLGEYARLAVAGLVTAGTSWLVSRCFAVGPARLLIALCAGTAVYVLACYAFRVAVVMSIVRNIWRKIAAFLNRRSASEAAPS